MDMQNQTIKDVQLPFLGRVGVIDENTSTENIRKVVMDGKEMKILPASVWGSFSWGEVRMLLHETGVYVVPTEELIDYLDKQIGEHSASRYVPATDLSAVSWASQ